MSLSRHRHTLHAKLPGSHWRPQVKAIVHGHHTTVLGQLLSPDHYDVYIRYGLARAFIQNRNSPSYRQWADLYDRMQIARVGRTHRPAFEAMIQHYRRQPDKLGQVALPVARNYQILDGSHRLALMALWNIAPRVIIHRHPSHTYRRQWFRHHGFRLSELKTIDRIRLTLEKKYQSKKRLSYVILVWGTALDHWDDIVSFIDKKNISQAFIRDFGSQAAAFIRQAYATDAMKRAHIVIKARRLARTSTKVGFLSVTGTHQSLVKKKLLIRKKIAPRMLNYFFDNILHLVDSPSESTRLLNRYGIR